MAHGDGVVGVGGAHVENDHRRGVVGGSMADFVPGSAVPMGYQRYPAGRGLRGHHEPGVGFTGLPVQRGGGQHHHPLGVPLRGVLPVAAALRLLGANLGGGRVHVGDVDEGGVPLLPLGHGEVQTQQVDEAEGEQPRREGQTAAGRHQRARRHGGPPRGERSEDTESFSADEHYYSTMSPTGLPRVYFTEFIDANSGFASPFSPSPLLLSASR